jgi:peptidoglycan/LPS O-acetylase OafA/YrhL
LLCLAILPFDLNWLPDTRIFRSALGGLLAVWLPTLLAPSHKRRVAVGALVFIVAGFGALAWLDVRSLLELGIWAIVVELVSPALATILALVFATKKGSVGGTDA